MPDSILDKVITTHQNELKDNLNFSESIEEMLNWLTSRESQVVRLRFGLDGNKPQTLEKIGKAFDITRERVRQIEHSSIVKIKETPAFREVARPLEQVIVSELTHYGGARESTAFIRNLIGGNESDRGHQNALVFIVTNLLDDVEEIEHEDALPSWKVKHASLTYYDSILTELIDLMKREGQPLPFDHLWEQFTGCQFYQTSRDAWIDDHPLPNEAITDDHLRNNIQAYLEISKRTEQNPFQEWGLRTWATIRPKRMSDKIFLVLKKHASPLHFNEMTDVINKTQFDHKVAHAPTVHNELILDNRFVLVGRGIYALREWGYKDGVVADVITDVLRQAGRPLTRDEIVSEVSKLRIVKKGTIYLSLSDKVRFNRSAEGKYTLIETAS